MSNVDKLTAIAASVDKSQKTKNTNSSIEKLTAIASSIDREKVKSLHAKSLAERAAREAVQTANRYTTADEAKTGALPIEYMTTTPERQNATYRPYGENATKAARQLYENRMPVFGMGDDEKAKTAQEVAERNVKYNIPRKASLYDLTIGSAKRGYYSAEQGKEIFEKIGSDDISTKYDDMLASREYNFKPRGLIAEAVSGASELAGQQISQTFDPLTAAAIGTGAAVGTGAGLQTGAVIGSIVPGAGTAAGGGTGALAGGVAGAGTGWKAGSTANNFRLEAGLAYKEYIEKGIDPDLAAVMAYGVGGGNAALEFMQLKGADKLFEKVGSKGLKAAAEYLKNIGAETLQEVAQEGVTIGGGALGAKIDNKEGYTTEEVIDRLKDTAASSALSFGLMGAGGAVANNAGAVVGNVKNKATEVWNKRKENATRQEADAKDIQQAENNAENSTEIKNTVSAPNDSTFETNNQEPKRQTVYDNNATSKNGGYVKYDDTLSDEQKTAFEASFATGQRYNASKRTSDTEGRKAVLTAKKLGLDVVFFDGADNGFIKDRTVYINRSAQNPTMAVLGHEAMHSAMTDKSIKSDILGLIKQEVYQSREFKEKFGERKALYEQRLGREVADDEIYEEFAADMAGDMFCDENFINRITAEKPNLAERILQFFRDIAAKLKGTRYTAGGKSLNLVDDADKVIARYEKAFAKARMQNSNEKYSINADINGNTYVKIDADILKGVDKKDWIKTIKNVMRERFSDGIQTENGIVFVSKRSTDEFTRSKYTQGMNTDLKRNKFKMANNLDEIVKTQNNLQSEDLKHERNDNFISFERGNVTVEIGNKAFSADVVIGNTKTGKRIFYDMVNLKPTKIKKDASATHTATVQNVHTVDTSQADASFDKSISQDKENVKYSLEENTNIEDLSTEENAKRFAENVDKVFKGEMPERRVITIGDTPTLLQEYGAKDLPITINQSTMYKIAYPQGYYGAEEQGHNLGIPALKQLPKQIANPMAILKSNTQDNSLILLTEWKDAQGNPVIIPLHLNKNGIIGITNEVASAYGTGSKAIYGKNKSNVIYTKNNESIEKLLQTGLQLPGVVANDTLVSKNNISQKKNDVKYSLEENTAEEDTKEPKAKTSRFYSNTIKRWTELSEEELNQIDPTAFLYIPEGVKTWERTAVLNVQNDIDGVMERIKNSESITGGVMAHEAAIIEQQLLNRYRQTGDMSDFVAFSDWTQTVSEKTRETARALKATDTAWEKSPAAAVAKAHKQVDKEIEKADKDNPKKAKEREKKVKEHVENLKDIENTGIEKLADEVESRQKEREKKPPEQVKERNDKKTADVRQRITDKLKSKFEKDVKKRRFVDRIMNDLFGKKGILKEEAQAKNNTGDEKNSFSWDVYILDIKRAIEKRGEFYEVWEAAKAEMMKEFKDDTEALAKIDAYFADGKPPKIPVAKVDRVIKEGFAIKGYNLREVVLDYYSTTKKKDGEEMSRREMAMQKKADLCSYIAEQTGLDEHYAKDLAKFAAERFDVLVTKEKKRYLKRFAENEKLVMKAKVSASEIEKVKKRIDVIFNTEAINRFKDAVYEDKSISPKIMDFIRARGVDLREIVKNAVAEEAESRGEYLDKLFEELNGQITEIDKATFETAVLSAFARMAEVKRDEVLSKYFIADKTGEYCRQKQTQFDKIIELVRLTAQESESGIRDAYLQKQGIDTLTNDEIKNIIGLVEAAQKLDENSRAYKTTIAKAGRIIENKRKSGIAEKVRAWQRNCLLLNPKTIVTRNAGANIVMFGVYNAENVISAGVDKAVSKLTKNRTAAMPDIATQAKGFKKGAAEAWDDLKNGYNTRGFESRYDIGSGVIFKSKTLNRLNNLVGGLLDMGDRPFYEAYKADIIRQQMVANNVTEATDEMIEVAEWAALERTWQDNNKYTEIVADFKKALNKLNIKGYGLGDVILPFIKTPANLLRASMQYSPVGGVKALTADMYELIDANKKGRPTAMLQRKFVDELSKAIVGTIVLFAGVAFARAGTYIGGHDDDDDRASAFQQYAEGRQGNSINTGENSVSLSWLQPLGNTLAMGATFHELSKENAPIDEKLIRTFSTMFENLINTSVLQSLRDLLSEDYSDTGFAGKLIESVGNGISQLVPINSALGQTTSMFDNTLRSTYDPNKAMKLVKQIGNKMPGFSKYLDPSLDAFGNERARVEGKSAAARIFNSFFNPANVRKINQNEVYDELDRVYESTGNSSVYPDYADKKVKYDGKEYQLTAEQYTEYQRELGKKSYKLVCDLLENEKPAEDVTGKITVKETKKRKDMTETC